MKNKILSLAFVAMSAFAFSSFAQTPCNGNQCPKDEQCKPRTECIQAQNCPKDNPDCCTKGKADCCPGAGVFDKMKLTDNQKAEVKALAQKRMQSCKLAKQRCDSTGRAYRMAEDREYLNNLKKIIGQDNYVLFLEESYINGAGMRAAKAHKRPGHDKQRKAKTPKQPRCKR